MTGKSRLRKIWNDHSASVISGSLWLIMSGVAYWMGLDLFYGTAEHEGDPATLIAYQRWFWFEWIMSMLADVFGAFFIIVLLIKWRERNSDAA